MNNIMGVKSLEGLHKELSKIRELENCRTCICFYGTIDLLNKEIKRSGTELTEIREGCHRWLKEMLHFEVHDCLGCEPCLPFKAYDQFRKSLNK